MKIARDRSITRADDAAVRSNRRRATVKAMENQGEPSRLGDVILDRYMATSEPKEREEGREQLRRFLAWQMRIIMRQVREELADSPDTEDCDTLDSPNLLP